MKNIQSFIREHPLCQNALWLLLFVPLFFLSQFPLITMVYSLQEGMDARWITILTLFVTVVVLFLLLLMANNLLAYPLLKQEAGGTTANQAALNELQSHAPFLAMGMVVILVAPILEELLCRAIIPRLIFRGAEPIGYLAGALFFTYLHGPSALGEWVAYGGMSLILTWVAYRYQRIEYSICLHMTLNALAYYYPAVFLLCLLPVSRVFFHDKL